jgi:hypothetical protein
MGGPIEEDFCLFLDDRLIVKMVMIVGRKGLQLNVGCEPVGA